MKKTLLAAALTLGLGIAGGLAYFKLALPSVGRAPELKVEITPERLKRGEYLARHVSACTDCHSQRDWSRYAGPAKPDTDGVGGEKFALPFGELFAPNITPTHLSGWTDGELYRAIVTGVSKDGHPLFPLMPYPRYGKMASEDIYSIIAYLRSLKALPGEAPASHLSFPMNLIVRTIPREADPQPVPQDDISRGKYLLTAAACEDCHTQQVKGAPMPGMALAGGREFDVPSGGKQRSANITPDAATGIGKWTRQQFIDRFRKFKSEPVAAGGQNTIMPWPIYTEMTEADLGAMYDYLKTVPAVNNAVKN